VPVPWLATWSTRSSLSMLPLDVPPDTTIALLVTQVIPELHARLVGPEGPSDVFTIAVRIEGYGSWTVRIRGPEMRVDPGETDRPTLWMYTTQEMADRFLQDAIGPRRLLPRPPPVSVKGVLTMSDPRVIKRVAMASGRIELAALEDDGGRIALVFGFGDAARRPIDPSDPDTVAEAPIAVLERMLRGDCGPEEALSSGEVTVRGSRLLAFQLALAIAPFYRPAG
jgi:putative sterol carrier protein